MTYRAVIEEVVYHKNGTRYRGHIRAPSGRYLLGYSKVYDPLPWGAKKLKELGVKFDTLELWDTERNYPRAYINC